MEQWLIRTAQNWIAGPYPREQVCQMILEGRLSLQDEICLANGYWISLHERDEIKRQLGVDVPRVKIHSEEEVTETINLFGEDEQTDPDVQLVHPPELAQQMKNTETTAVFSSSMMRKDSKNGKPSAAPKPFPEPIPPPKVQVVGELEQNSLSWRRFIWLMLSLVAICLSALAYLLNHQE